MKKKVFVTLLSVALTALLSVPLTIDILVYSLPDVYQNTLYGAMKNKIDLLKKSNGKKIVVIGGSSVPFSLDSFLIKQYLNDYEVVDYGLYASLGTNVMLDLGGINIQEGDIYIISPEISKQTLSMYYNGRETFKALERNKDMYFSLDSKMKESLIGSAPLFVADKLSYLTSNTIPEPKDIYAEKSFNFYGDIQVFREGNIMLGGVDNNNPIVIDTKLIEDNFINKLNDFNKACLNRNAKCYYRFSPMNDASIKNKDNIESFYNYLDEILEFDILGDPYNAILEKEWFYDTNFHLNSYGVINWTKQIIKDIKLTLDDSSKTDIADASKPPLINPKEDKDGDDSFLDYFEYETKDNEVTITGIKKEANKIIVPYRYQDKVITSFNNDVFNNCKIIKELVIQDNIRLLHDYSFTNSNIEKVIILNDEPNSIGVGDYLLDNSSAFIYVNKDNLSTYKTSYNWMKYAAKIKEIN